MVDAGRRQLKGMVKDLRGVQKSVRKGRLRQRDKILLKLGRIEEPWGGAWKYLKDVGLVDGQLHWEWEKPTDAFD